MSARQDLIALLDPLLPGGWDTYSYPASVDAIESGSTVLLVDTYAEQAEPVRGLRAHTLTLALVVGYSSSPDADDALDVGSLIHWTDATRSTFVSAYPSLTIPVQMRTKD